nr:aminopeptidase [Rhodoferax sp. PAMC 29310]
MATLAVLGFSVGCADGRYYFQSVSGHVKVMQAARPVSQWLSDDQASPALKQRLKLSQKIRQFSVTELHLPDNENYRRFADLHRRAVVWNVVAAPEFSLTLHTWCFPVVGCVAYRGYYAEADAQAEAAALRLQGLEVRVYGVPAYSTLGWLNWAGGDPLLNTFIQYPDGELARMIIHELAHQVLYVKDDTVFNESFATAVERLGGLRWLAIEGTPMARQQYEAFDARRQQFRDLSLGTRHKLEEIYEKNQAVAFDPTAVTAMKNEAISEFRSDYQRLKATWNGYNGYDAWVAGANNAAFGAQAAYDDLVPGFEALFEREGRDWPRFYEAVKRLAELPIQERTDFLKNLSPEYSRG